MLEGKIYNPTVINEAKDWGEELRKDLEAWVLLDISFEIFHKRQSHMCHSHGFAIFTPAALLYV